MKLWSPPWQELQEEEEEKILHGLLYNSDPGFVFIPTNMLTGLKNQSCHWFFLSLHLLFFNRSLQHLKFRNEPLYCQKKCLTTLYKRFDFAIWFLKLFTLLIHCRFFRSVYRFKEYFLQPDRFYEATVHGFLGPQNLQLPTKCSPELLWCRRILKMFSYNPNLMWSLT